MQEQKLINYERIATAVRFLQANANRQPSLDELAAVCHLSPAHFQKLFSEFAGTSPKRYLQFLTLEHAKHLLRDAKLNLFETVEETGLSSGSRLHDLFVSVEGMSPKDFQKLGKGLHIAYDFYPSIFGNLLVAATEKGICRMAFTDDNDADALQALLREFPEAQIEQQHSPLHDAALRIFESGAPERIKLHLKGSAFQLKVWEALLKIPAGAVSTYSRLAEASGNPKAARAVGNAIGDNPIAFIIPCHRVIRTSGAIGGYMWSPLRKSIILAHEAAKRFG